MSNSETRYIYRAKELQMGKFVYGAYLKFLPYTPYPVGNGHIPETDYKHLIITEGFSDWGLPRELRACEIDVNTLEQCTGLKDKNGKAIYEGDVLKEENGKTYIVEWNSNHATFFIERIEKIGYFDTWHLARHDLDYEVIGNVHENPELYKGGSNE